MPLPLGSSTAGGQHLLNQAVDLQVGSGQHLKVVLNVQGSNAVGGQCTLTGTMDTLG